MNIKNSKRIRTFRRHIMNYIEQHLQYYDKNVLEVMKRFWDSTDLTATTYKFRHSTIKLTPNGRYILSHSDKKGVIRITDIDDLHATKSINTYLRNMRSCSISHISNLLMVYNLHGIVIHDLTTRKLVRHIVLSGPVSSCTMSYDGRTLMICTSLVYLQLMDVRTGKHVYLERYTCYIENCTFSHDDKYVLYSYRTCMRIRNVEDPQDPGVTIVEDSNIVSCSFSSDDRSIISHDEDKLIKIWDVKSGNCIRVFNEFDCTVTHSMFSYNNMILGISHDEIKIWDLLSTKPINTIPIKCGNIRLCLFSLLYKTIVIQRTNGVVHIYDIERSLRKLN